MIVALKIVHFVALLLGGAAGIGNLLISLQLAKQPGPPPPLAARLRPTLSILGLVAILLLWISGALLVSANYGGADLGAAFTVKLVAAALVLAGSVATVSLGIAAARRGAPPPATLLESLGKGIGVAVLVAIICAVIVFT